MRNPYKVLLEECEQKLEQVENENARLKLLLVKASDLLKSEANSPNKDKMVEELLGDIEKEL